MFNKICIYKENLINNIKQVKHDNPNSKVCAMVKANAYGVGANEVVQILEPFVDYWGVACFFEAQQISAKTQKQILILGALERDCVDERYSYACGNLEDLKFLISLKKQIKIHIKINTGMNRFGFKSIKEFKQVLNLISHSNLVFEGLFTHFATTDEHVEKQMNEFEKYIKVTHRFGYYPIIHADKSLVNEKFNHHLDMVRIGYSLYNRDEGWFLPAVEIKSKIVETVKVSKGELVGYNYRFVAKHKMNVAIIPIGYADGFDLKYIGLNLKIDGVECQVLNVCMDCFMLDITNSKLKKGDEIVILNKFNPLKTYAKFISTSEYHIMTNFSHMRCDRVII